MIYLIGGTPRSGKSILATQLSEHLGIPLYSTDDLEGEVRESTPEEELGTKFPKTVIRKEANQSNDEMYSKFTTEQITKAYVQQSRAVWDEIEKLAGSKDCIVEGYHIHPELVSRLEKKFDGENVRSVFLTRSNIKKIVNEATQFASEGDWFIEWTENESTYPMMAKMIKEFSEYLEAEARKHKLRTYNVDGQFEGKLNEALAYLQQ